jgi:hypothetical protein
LFHDQFDGPLELDPSDAVFLFLNHSSIYLVVLLLRIFLLLLEEVHQELAAIGGGGSAILPLHDAEWS